MKGNKTALLLAANGITEGARREVERLAGNHMYILCIEKKDLLEISKEDECTLLILNKWQELLRKVENEPPI